VAWPHPWSDLCLVGPVCQPSHQNAASNSCSLGRLPSRLELFEKQTGPKAPSVSHPVTAKALYPMHLPWA
jgi:hypothetical protein